jgi:UPF0755 protein
MTGAGDGSDGPKPKRNRNPKGERESGKRRTRRKRGQKAEEAPAQRAQRPGGRPGISLARWGLAAVALVVLAAFAWLFAVYPSERGPGDGHPSEVVVSGAPSPGVLAATLASAGVLRRPRWFALWVRLTGGTGAVVAGRHLLTDDATPRELMDRLERRSAGATQRVTFPEGWTRFDMARRLQDKHVVPLRDFLDASTDPALLHELGIDGDSAEGFLFPATYDLPFDSDPRDVVRRMKREFDRRWDILSRAHGSSLNDVLISARLGVRDVVTLASMVEKEAVVDEERPIIASVFLNRLRDPAFKPKHLECDPTASYGCIASPERAGSCADFTWKATAAIEHDPDNPYSTYTHEGLPPGPIANPGARSLEGAMAPAISRYFFFVARGEGRHTFSETYEAHVAAVRGSGAGKRSLAASAETLPRE